MNSNYTYSEFISENPDYAKVPVFLLLGADGYLIEKTQRKIRSQLIKSHAADLVILYGDEATASELSEQLDVYSVFSDAKIIVLRNADLLRKEALETLANYVSSPSEDQNLIITCTKIDSRLSAWKKIKEASVCVNCDPPRFSGDVRAWLDAELKSLKRSMTPLARDAFLARIELDYSTIDNELNKLLLFTVNKDTISDADVAQSLGTTRTGALADLFRALGNRDAKKALTQMQQMLEADWEPLGILGQMQKFFLSVRKIQLLMENRITESEIITKHLMDIFQSYRKDYIEYAKRYKNLSMSAIFEMLLKTDSQLKLTASTPEMLLSICIVELISPKQ